MLVHTIVMFSYHGSTFVIPATSLAGRTNGIRANSNSFWNNFFQVKIGEEKFSLEFSVWSHPSP